MAKQKPGDEHHRPGDAPEHVPPADETAGEDLVEMVDEDVVDVSAEDEVHDIVEVPAEAEAPEPDIFDLTDAEAIPEPTTAGESGSAVKIHAPSDADLLAQLSAEADEEEVVHLTGSHEGHILPFASEPTGPGSGIDVGLPTSEDSSNVDLAGLEPTDASAGSPSGVDVMDFGKADQPLGEGDSGAWRAPEEATVVPRRTDSTLDLGTLEPSDQPSGASDVPINFTLGDQPLTREGAASAWETDAPPPAALGGDQGSSIDLGVPGPTAPPGAVSDLRLMPEAMDSGMRLEGSAEQSALPAGAGHGDLTDADLDLGALDRSPDIAEQIESNQHLSRGAEDVVDLDEAAAEALGGEDDVVDLGGAAETPADETAAAEDDAVDLGAAAETEEAPAGSEDIDPDMQALADEFAAGGETASEEGAEEEADEEEPAPAKKPAKAEKKGGGIGGVLVGAAVGLLIGAGGLYGSLAGGVVDPAMLGLAASKQSPLPQPRPPVIDDATPEKAHVALNTGDLDKALDVFGKVGGEDPKVMASHGQALWLKSLQNLAKNNVDPAKFGEELKKDDGFNKAKEILTKAAEAKDADAVFWLAEIEEWTEGTDKAKARIQAGLQEFANDPTQKQRFEAAMNRLNLQAAAKPGGEARLRQPVGAWIALALLTMQVPMPPGIPADPKPVAEQEEAGDEFWKAIGLAQKRQYPQALEALEKAQKTHARMRLLRPKQQQNPRSDPMERIFLAACDEIRQRWQLESGSAAALAGLKDYDALVAELAAQKEPAKMLAALAAAVQAVAGEVSNAKLEKFDDPKKLKLADLPAAIKAGGLGGAGEKEKLDAVVSALKAAKVDKFKDAEEGMAFTKEELAKGVQDVLGMVAAEKEKAANAVKALGEEKARTDAALAALKDAKVEKAKDVADGVKALAGERDKAQSELTAANTTLDAVLKPLVENKHLPANAKRTDAPKGVTNLLATADHPAVRGLAEAVRELGSLGGKVSDEMLKGIDVRAQLVASSAENLKLRAQLMDRQSPEQMLALWRAALQGGADKATAEMALKDAARMTDPSVKNQAQIITAMASRSQGKFDEARTALKGVKLPEGSPWQATADWLNAELSDPRTAYLPAIRKARDEGNHARALSLANEALEAFPKDGFIKENATLTAVRGLVRLDKALAAGKLSPEVAKEASADAASALAAGETIEGNYLAGRVAEAEGDLPKAEAAYKAALAAYLAANPKSDEGLAAFHKDHPACDPIGNRYRVALARVIVGQRVGAAPAAAPTPFAPPAPKEEKKPEAEAGRPSAALPSNPKVVLVADARKDAGVGLGEAPAVKVGLPVARPLPAMVWVGGCPSVLSLPTLMVDPAVVIGDEEPGIPPDPRLDEAIRLAEEAVRLAKTSRDPRAYEAYLVLGEARARRGRWTEGLFDFVEGLKVLCPQYGPRLAVLVADHPAFKRPDAILPPDPLRAEGFYGRGLRLYFEGRYGAAEKEFLQAVRFHNQDARYLYFLGLSRLGLGQLELALEDFRLGARLEVLEKPARGAVSFSLERVQGPHRRLLNGFRDRAEREAVGVGP